MAFFRRGESLQLTKDFHSREMTCGCGVCSEQSINSGALQALQKLRDAYGLPITITSAYRCARYQEILRNRGYETAKGISSHEMGIAFDITASDMPKLSALAPTYFANIGTSPRFLHVDARTGGPRRWIYKK